MIEKADCANCGRAIDRSARLCPFCGANPRTGEKVDAAPVLREHFQHGRRELTLRERVIEFVRERQGIAVALVVIVVYGLVLGVQQFVGVADETAAAESAPAVPLTEVTDLAERGDEVEDLPMPKLEFQYTGEPRRMRTFLVEPGAVAPPPEQPEGEAAAASPQQPAAVQQAARN